MHDTLKSSGDILTFRELANRRVIAWAGFGFLVGCLWVAYAFVTAPDYEQQQLTVDLVVQVIAYATCPIIVVAPRYYWIPLANAATYGFLRFCFGLFRKR